MSHRNDDSSFEDYGFTQITCRDDSEVNFENLKQQRNLKFDSISSDIVVSTDLCNLDKNRLLVANEKGLVNIWDYESIYDRYIEYIEFLWTYKPKYPLGYVPTEDDIIMHESQLNEAEARVSPLQSFKIPNLLFCKWLNNVNNENQILCTDTKSNLLIYDLNNLKAPFIKKKHANEPVRYTFSINDYSSHNICHSDHFYYDKQANLITCMLKNNIKFFDVRIGQFIGTLMDVENPTCGMYNPVENQLLYVGNAVGNIYCYDIRAVDGGHLSFMCSNSQKEQNPYQKPRYTQLLHNLELYRKEKEIQHQANVKLCKPKYFAVKCQQLHDKLGFQSEDAMWDFVRSTSNKRQKLKPPKLFREPEKPPKLCVLDNLFYNDEPDYEYKEYWNCETSDENDVSYSKRAAHKKGRNLARNSSRIKEFELSFADHLENALYKRDEQRKMKEFVCSAHHCPVNGLNFVMNTKYLLSNNLLAENPYNVFSNKNVFKLWNPYNGYFREILYEKPSYLFKAPTDSELHEEKLLAFQGYFKKLIRPTRCEILKLNHKKEFLISGMGKRLLVHNVFNGDLVSFSQSSHAGRIISVFCPNKNIEIYEGIGGLLTIDCFGGINCWTAKNIFSKND